MSFDRLKPYNDLPLLPPDVDLETNAVLKRAIAASRALAELKGASDLIPNPAMLVHAIFLQEAKVSSEIESVVTTNDKLYQALSGHEDRFDPSTKEVLRYGDALWKGYSEIRQRPLSTDVFIEIVNTIKQNEQGIRRHAGTRIAEGVRTFYTPPQGEERIRELLRNLEQFLGAKDQLDPLVKMAVAHYQFEAIHPFADGNGRTGRIVNILYLVSAGLLNLPVLYLSRYILENRPAYYRLLRGVTEDRAWEPWIVYMLRAVETTSLATRDKVLEIRALFDEMVETVREKKPKVYTKELVEAIFQQPYCRISQLEVLGIGTRNTVSMYLRELESVGLLRSVKAGRDLLYLNDRLFKILSR